MVSSKSNFQLVSFEETKKGFFYSFIGTNSNELATHINSFFISEGYKLESGSIVNGDYGKGSNSSRLLVGSFAKRFKFHIYIYSKQDNTILEFSKAMSGASGGIIGASKMNKEFEKFTNAFKSI